MRKEMFLGVLVLFLLCVPLISSPPPSQFNLNTDIGLQLESPIKEVQTNGQDYIYDIHVFNITDGVLLSNDTVECRLHLYDTGGNHQVELPMGFDDNGIDFELLVLGTNFTDNALHNILVNCNVTDPLLIKMGGFIEWSFTTNPTGTVLEESNSIIYFVLLLGTLFILLLVLWGSVVIPFQNPRSELGKIIKVQYLKYIKILFMSLAYMLILWTFNLLHTLSINFSILSQYTNYFALIFAVLNAVALPLFIFVFVGSLFLMWKDLKLEKLLMRGLNER